MKSEASPLDFGGKFYFKHFDSEGNLKGEGDMHNLFVDEGLVYALNTAFAVSIGGAPTPISQFYVGLSTANRAWLGGDNASNVHVNSNEFTLYGSSYRPDWAPQTLAIPGSIELSDDGHEATFNIDDLSGVGGSAILYGGFIISANQKNGSGDSTATMLSGSNFSSPRELFSNDVFKIGYVLKAESGTI